LSGQFSQQRCPSRIDKRDSAEVEMHLLVPGKVRAADAAQLVHPGAAHVAFQLEYLARQFGDLDHDFTR